MRQGEAWRRIHHVNCCSAAQSLPSDAEFSAFNGAPWCEALYHYLL